MTSPGKRGRGVSLRSSNEALLWPGHYVYGARRLGGHSLSQVLHKLWFLKKKKKKVEGSHTEAQTMQC